MPGEHVEAERTPEACLVYDRLAHGRVHPAFLWGGIFVMAALPARFEFGWTDAWLPVARWLTA